MKLEINRNVISKLTFRLFLDYHHKMIHTHTHTHTLNVRKSDEPRKLGNKISMS